MSGNHSIEYLPEFFCKIVSQNAADAFCYIVGKALSSGRWDCKTKYHGLISSFRYCDDKGSYPFSFIVNPNHLLFYVTKKGKVLLGNAKVTELHTRFPCLEKENSKDEIRIPIKTLDEAIKLVKFLFPKK